jgi:SAM-dependent methyltransferase
MPEVDLWSLTDLQTPWCIHVVATLRIAEHIAAGATDIETLAMRADCDREALYSVLTYLVGRGVFEEPTTGEFALNAPARALLEPGARVSLDLDGIGGRMAHAWGTLLKYVRTGAPGYADVFGAPFWEDLDRHPEVGSSFDALMGAAGHGTPDPDVLLRDDWSKIRHVVDVGGGNGSLLAEILKARPHLTGTLVDLPRAAAASAEVFQAAGVADRATALGQSFFDPLPGGADLYVLMKVLNDWPDRDAARILARCAEAARPNGRVIVCGGVSPDAVPRGLVIEMVLVGGRSRGLEQFAELARDAGLRVVEAGPLRSGRFAVQLAPIS